MPIVMHATMPVKPEMREPFLNAIPKLVEASNAEEGVQFYQCYESLAEPNTFVMIEVYADKAAMDAHLASPHFQQAGKGLGMVLAGKPTLTYFEAGDPQNLPM
ncbi:putative quinol monooxygenase [Sporichthya brevicatena]|uniref:Quinol monooxygenase n=1 Tax=Sporichthya brevicatena TaxID=171442 RepID=A0ABN1GXD8_9ACTN